MMRNSPEVHHIILHPPYCVHLDVSHCTPTLTAPFLMKK
jgi:hypothetical protein